MTINNCEVVPSTARYFRAIGGGWAVKMNLPGKSKREYVLGPYDSEKTAEAIVRQLNGQDEESVRNFTTNELAEAA